MNTGEICENCHQGIAEEVIPEPTTLQPKCVVCGVNWVDVNEDEDTCESCLISD
jgi:hypothetical protein